jgi:hypothetical protein
MNLLNMAGLFMAAISTVKSSPSVSAGILARRRRPCRNQRADASPLCGRQRAKNRRFRVARQAVVATANAFFTSQVRALGAVRDDPVRAGLFVGGRRRRSNVSRFNFRWRPPTWVRQRTANAKRASFYDRSIMFRQARLYITLGSALV